MTRHLYISSSTNPRLKALRRLHGRRAREAGVFLVEGHRQLRCALEAGAHVRHVFFCPELFIGERDGELVRRSGAEAVELSPAAFRSVSGNGRADGLLAVVERWSTALDGPLDPSLVLVAESVERPGNLGTIVRTACGAGATAVVVADPCTDVFHPETVRGSVGTIFGLPIRIGTTAEAIERLRGRARIVVASPAGERAVWDADLAGPTALVVGNERSGVSDSWLAAADEVVAVPLPGPADSLNVAVAAGVVLYEAGRRRRGSPTRRDAAPLTSGPRYGSTVPG